MPNSPARDKVIDEVVRKIHTNEYNPNTYITEADLCEKMGLSRTPVREALIKLSARGLLIRVPQKGYRVRQFDLKTKLDSYLVLAVLDATAARLAINHLTDAHFLRMSEIIDLIDIAIKYKNYDRYNELQEQFHEVYIENCNNLPLQKEISDYKQSIPSYLYYSEDSGKLFDLLLKVNDEHREILHLLKEKKGPEVFDYLTRVHWQTDYEDMV